MGRTKLLFLAAILCSFVGVTGWITWHYDQAYTLATRHTQLSAWALAQLELELAGQRLPVTPVGDGEYRAELAAPLTEGSLPVTATVVAGDDSDLLAGALDWHAPTAAPSPGTGGRMRWLAGAAGALAALGAALWAWRGRRAAPQATARVGGAV